jgi:hypothetical protein
MLFCVYVFLLSLVLAEMMFSKFAEIVFVPFAEQFCEIISKFSGE